VVFTWPLAMGLARDVPGDLGDSLLNMWILAWGAERLPALLTGAIGWQTFWTANIFHPEPYALALSEHLVAQSLQAAPIYAATGNIILCYNLLFLSSFVLSALGAYLLARDLTADWRAAFIAGLVYGFLPYRVSQVPHLQILTSQWMPFALWGLHRHIARGSTLALAGATTALVVQNWSCGYYLLYFAPIVPIFAVHQLWIAGRLPDRRAWLAFGAAAVVTAALTVPAVLPYLEAQRRYALERPIGEVVAFSANVWSYATAAEPIHLWGRLLRLHPHGEGETFLGITAALLAVVSLAASFADARRSVPQGPPLSVWRRVAAVAIGVALAAQGAGLLSAMVVGGFSVEVLGVPLRATTPVRLLLQSLAALGLLLLVAPRTRGVLARWLRSPVACCLALLLLAVWLSLGPYPSAGPVRVSGLELYSLLYDHVPGFTGVRVPARYSMIAGLFLAVLAGFGARTIARRAWRGPALALASLLIVVDGAAMPLAMNHTWAQGEATPPSRVFPASAAPAVYHRLRALPAGSAIAEFPFGDAAWELRYVYYSSVHGRPILNGYSGAFPPAYQRRVAALNRWQADGDSAWRALTDAGATHVVVHAPAFANPDAARDLVAWLELRRATLVEAFPDGDALYALPAR
jgi:hypothetical protein